jgi:hypothetical protein
VSGSAVRGGREAGARGAAGGGPTAEDATRSEEAVLRRGLSRAASWARELACVDDLTRSDRAYTDNFAQINKSHCLFVN